LILTGLRIHPSFDAVAWAYDTFMRLFGLYKDEAIVAALELSGDESIVDLGGGTGHYAATLAPLCREATVVDISEQMLSRVPRLTNVRTLHADMAATGLREDCFDAALITDVLHHAPDQAKLIAEAHRILKPGGRLLILDFNAAYARTRPLGLFERPLFGSVHYLTPAETTDLLTEHGFAARLASDGWCFLVAGAKI